jgi:hypothetical protein
MKQGLVLGAMALTLALAMNGMVYAEVHKSTGKVVRVSPAKGTLELVEKGRRLSLVMGKGAAILDEEGQPLKGLKAIHVGDYVREECSFKKDGPSVAKKITILKRAAEVEGSPEK